MFSLVLQEQQRSSRQDTGNAVFKERELSGPLGFGELKSKED